MLEPYAPPKREGSPPERSARGGPSLVAGALQAIFSMIFVLLGGRGLLLAPAGDRLGFVAMAATLTTGILAGISAVLLFRRHPRRWWGFPLPMFLFLAGAALTRLLHSWGWL